MLYKTLYKKKIFVTGGSSMIGYEVVKQLQHAGAHVRFPTRIEVDLLDYGQTIRYIENFLPDIIVHLAGFNGGIEFNKNYPQTIFYRTVQMGLNVLTAASETPEVEKVLSVISSCAYPEGEVMEESQLWDGPCNKTIECHGVAKRMLDVYSRMIVQQNPNKNFITTVLNNCFGPHDSFNLDKCKVVSATIRKVYEAKIFESYGQVPEFWGTGAAKRQFVFSRDAAKGIILALMKYEDSSEPLNISNPQEISIKELVELVCELSYYMGDVKWLTEKGDGQLIKRLDTSKMESLFNLEFTPFLDALSETIVWYAWNKEYANNKV